jgi:lipid-binding SYLF domain-containing protein
MSSKRRKIMANTHTKSLLILIVFLVISLSMPFSIYAAQNSKEIERVENAEEAFKAMMEIPEEGIPESLLNNAEAIAVIPGFWKAAWGIGGRHGKGVIVVRKDKGVWSYPAFISMTGGSLGFQIGVQRADIVLVFKSKKSVRTIDEGKFTLGADAGVAAGPLGRKAEANTDIKFEAEIYSYSKSKGLFAGVSIEGAILSMDRDSNAKFYRDFDLAVNDILSKDTIDAPSVAAQLRQTISKYTR